MDPYHDDLEHWSNTMLSYFCKSHYDAFRYFVGKTSRLPDFSRKTNMSVGDCVHQVLLERKKVDEVCIALPLECLKSNGAINPKPTNQFIEDNPGKHAIKQQDVNRVETIIDAVCAHKLGEVLSDTSAKFEQAIYWIDQDTGIPCRAKPDFHYPMASRVLAYDLKVTEQIYPDEWRRTARRFSYWRQAAHYSNGLQATYKKPVDFIFWTIEAFAPHRIARRQYSPIATEITVGKYKQIMRDLKKCIDTGNWLDDWQINTDFIDVSPWDFDTNDEELEGCEEDE